MKEYPVATVLGTNLVIDYGSEDAARAALDRWAGAAGGLRARIKGVVRMLDDRASNDSPRHAVQWRKCADALRAALGEADEGAPSECTCWRSAGTCPVHEHAGHVPAKGED